MVFLKDTSLSITTNLLGGNRTEVVRTWDLCIKCSYRLLKTDIHVQKIKRATKQNENKFWNKRKDKEHYRYNYFSPEKQKT